MRIMMTMLGALMIVVTAEGGVLDEQCYREYGPIEACADLPPQ